MVLEKLPMCTVSTIVLVAALVLLPARQSLVFGQSKLCPDRCDSATKCPGKCGCKYNCDTKCKCNGLTTKGLDQSGNNGPDCTSYWQGKLHCYTDPNVCPDTKQSSHLNMPGTNIKAHWSFEACRNVDKPTAAPRKTPSVGHSGVRCVDYNDHDTTVNGEIHKCHWCYEKVNSHEFLSGDWLAASFDVHMDKVRNNGHGMFHIALTTSLGRSASHPQKAGWYEIGVYSNSFFVRRVTGTNRWRTVWNKEHKFGHNTPGSRGQIWVKQNHKTGQFLIGHGRCVGKTDTVLMDWTEDADKRTGIDRFEVQGYVNTHADFNICHHNCGVDNCPNEAAKDCPSMHGFKKPCPKGTWRPKGKDACQKCTILPSTTATKCGEDEVASGTCGRDINTLKCTACPCINGQKTIKGVCTCRKGTFKSGNCKSGFKCLDCESESKKCDDSTQFRIGECGRDSKPYNTWDCKECVVAGSSPASSVCSIFEYRTGECATDKEFKCHEQPMCKAGEYYRPGTSVGVDKATCEPCPSGTFMQEKSHRRRKCQDQRKQCEPGEYYAKGGEATPTSDLKCLKHSECNYDTEYESKAPSHITNENRECSSLLICPPGTYVSKPPTRSTNRECSPCDGVNEFSTKENQRSCDQVSFCSRQNQYVSVPATSTNDLKCKYCEDGQEQRVNTPHRERECTEITSTSSTTSTITSTSSSTSSTVTTTIPPEVQKAIEVAFVTVEKVQSNLQNCRTTLESKPKKSGKKFCLLDAETESSCFKDCTAIENVLEKITKRVRALRFSVEANTDKFRTSSLALPVDKKPTWCVDEDSQCAAYGEAICQTEGVFSCAEFCGCKYKDGKLVANVDEKQTGGESTTKKTTGKPSTSKPSTSTLADSTRSTKKKSAKSSSGDDDSSDETTTIAIVIVVAGLLIVCLVIGLAVYLVMQKKSRAGSNPQSFSNPAAAYDQPRYGHDNPVYGANDNSGYMDVGGYTQ